MNDEVVQSGEDTSTHLLIKFSKSIRPDPLLIVLSGPSLGQIIPLKQKSTVIGRKEDADISIKDDCISRRHCEIVMHEKAGEFILRDLDSKNGVFLNNEKVIEAELKDGDKIAVGVTTLKFIYQDAIDISYYRRIAELISTDPLTGLQNRYQLEIALKAEIDRCTRYNETFAIIMLDIDHFKSVNDTLGHLVGDKVLIALAQILRKQLRVSDSIYRYGGEEFLLILPQIKKNKGYYVAERLRSITERYKEENLPPFTISLGIANFPEDGRTSADLISSADKALYQAKEEGRNRLVIYQKPEE